MENELLVITSAQMMALIYKSKFGTQKELIVLSILKYKHCVKSHVVYHVTILLKNRKLLTNWWPV